ncbi:DUF7079 family protein [Photobacterium nomapromontoriensis]|uniref:DUF7079 family protein n=1 Tax=Photobacterium nomapromontoriensis TaxID=2910237 RepID=UPI003D12A646
MGILNILKHEVTPVCGGNLCCVAGVWDGFDESWLVDSIEEEIKKNKKHRINICRKIYHMYIYRAFIEESWIVIVAEIREIRGLF